MEENCKEKFSVWPEYEYRHRHVWNNIYKLSFTVAFLSVVPYLHTGVVVKNWAVWPPVLAIVLSAFGIIRAKRELMILDRVKKIHLCQQETTNELGGGNFTRDVKIYLYFLFMAFVANFYAILKIWIPHVIS